MITQTRQWKAVVIGVSAGGFTALHHILPRFSVEFGLPILIVQHRLDVSGNYMTESLNKKCQLTVKEAEDKEPIQTGYVYIAPAGYHLLVETDYTLSLCSGKPVNFSRPSIDVLFETAAEAFGNGLIGIILTGASQDGTQGIRTIKERGGLTIAQDPLEAEIDLMPQSAIRSGKVDFILLLDEIPKFVMSLFKDEL